MNLIDEVKIFLKSGDGGNGKVSFRREKFVQFGGPDGGHGGHGGNIIFIADNNLNNLLHFRYQQHFKAQAGETGKGENRAGKSGEDLIIKVPIGTQIFDETESFIIYDFLNNEDSFEILSGGKGGAGNSVFRSSTNQSPRKAIPGEPGVEMWVRLKLKILSDIGLIGLPNAGKSTFLSKVTNAKPKIADYPFTTLSPNLGMSEIHDNYIVIADIPGLIEGAHFGKGLGDKFLKHIERCKMLIHLIDGTSDNIIEDYETVRNEIFQYSQELSKKPYIICLNKIDVMTSDEILQKSTTLSEHTKAKVYNVSTYANDGLKPVLEEAYKCLEF